MLNSKTIQRQKSSDSIHTYFILKASIRHKYLAKMRQWSKKHYVKRIKNAK
jgi:hypothetical protein